MIFYKENEVDSQFLVYDHLLLSVENLIWDVYCLLEETSVL